MQPSGTVVASGIGCGASKHAKRLKLERITHSSVHPANLKMSPLPVTVSQRSGRAMGLPLWQEPDPGILPNCCGGLVGYEQIFPSDD